MRRSSALRLALLAAALVPFAGYGCGSSEPSRVATTIVVTPPTVNLASVGATQQLAAVVKDQGGDTMIGAAVTWSSGNTGFVTVSPTGLATAVANGTAQVTATSGTATGSSNVTVAQAAAQLTYVSGSPQSGTVAQALAQPLVVQVNDANAHPIPGATVTFATTAGTVGSPAAVTAANGQAQSTWTLGSTAGAQSATASIASLPAVTFTATADPGAAASVAKSAGDNQTLLRGTAVATAPAVVVRDAFNNARPGAVVTFAVASGGGSVTKPADTTDASGIASVGGWTLGTSAGANTLTATVTGAGIAGNPATFTATGLEGTFNIVLQNTGPALSTGAQAAFDSAVAKWQRIIYVDIPDVVNLTTNAGECSVSWMPATGPQNVDDILIFIRLDSIDGPLGTLGSAGPCRLRGTGWLPVTGHMRFDTADVAALLAAGQLSQTILHEMGHVLGFGTLWGQPTPNDCLELASEVGAPQDTYYDCAHGLAMFDSIGGTSYTGGNKVPVENCGPTSPAGCGTGTINGHWREPVLNAELMTGYLNGGVANPLSRLTVAAMEDLGYTVNYDASDAYTQAFSLRLPGQAGPMLFLGNDIHVGPLIVTDARGRVVRVIRPGARR